MRFWSELPREGRLLLSVVAVEFLGTGLILPFAVIYLHEVRGFSLSTVGLLLALPPLLGLLTVGPAGSAVDRLGARRVVVGVLALNLVADVLLAFSTRPWMAAVALVVNGMAAGIQWPAFQSLVAAVVPTPLRSRYLGINFTLLNLGVGLGGIVGGVFVDVHRPVTFEAIYLADAASFVPSLFLMLVPLRHVAGAVPVPDDAPAADTSYLRIIRTPAMPALVALSFLTSFVGYAQLDSGLPAFARIVGQVSTRSIGFAFAANTLVIVLLQLVVLRHIEGRRRTRVIVVMSMTWSLAWLVLGSAGLVPGSIGATLLVTAAMSVFAFGETLLQPTVPLLVNDLAPDHLRGRYNAVSQGAFSVAAVIAPPVAGFLIGHALSGALIGLLVAGCVATALLCLLRLEGQLPPAVNGVVADPAEVSAAG